MEGPPVQGESSGALPGRAPCSPSHDSAAPGPNALHASLRYAITSKMFANGWTRYVRSRDPIDGDAVRGVIVKVISDHSRTRDVNGEMILQDVNAALCGLLGDWAEGWRFSAGEGDGCGGVVSAWCCVRHCWTEDRYMLAKRIVDALCEWHAFLNEFDALLHELAPLGRQVGCIRVVDYMAKCTECQDAWYTHTVDAVALYLARQGVPENVAASAAEVAFSGVFASWSEPDRNELEAAVNFLDAELAEWLY